MAGVSLREFGRSIGVSGEAVRKAIKSGRIPAAALGTNASNGRPEIRDPDLARRSWGDNTNAAKAHQASQPRGDKRPAQPVQAPPPDIPAGPAGTGAGANYAKARAVRETFAAKLAQLEYEEKSGSLIPVDQVKLAQHSQGMRVREAVLNIPDRVTAALAAALGREIDPHTVHVTLEAELRTILQELAVHGRKSH